MSRKRRLIVEWTANALEIEVKLGLERLQESLWRLIVKKEIWTEARVKLSNLFSIVSMGIDLRSHTPIRYLRSRWVKNRAEFMCAEVVLGLLRKPLVKKNFDITGLLFITGFVGQTIVPFSTISPNDITAPSSSWDDDDSIVKFEYRKMVDDKSGCICNKQRNQQFTTRWHRCDPNFSV